MSTVGATEVGGAPSGRRARVRLVALVMGSIVLGACASEASTPPPPAPAAAPAAPAPATYSAALCSAAADFQTAANAIVTLDAREVGTEGVKRALQDLEAAAGDLMAAARDQFGPQVAELERAIASLGGTIAGLSSQDSASTNLGAIAASVGVVEQAARPIVDSVRTGCPEVPPVELPPAA